MKDIHLIIHPSFSLTITVALLYVLAGSAICFLSIIMPLKGIIILLHSIHFYTSWYDSLSLQKKEAIVYLQITADNHWILANREGEAYQGTLQSGSFCTPYLVILRFYIKQTQDYRCVLLCQDSLTNPDIFRQLRQRLRPYW
jgi:hypothetical protein